MINNFEEVDHRQLDELRQAILRNDDAEKDVQKAAKKLGILTNSLRRLQITFMSHFQRKPLAVVMAPKQNK
jgi:hypothetical protein